MVESLDVKKFKEKIFEYEGNNKDWKFEGDKPAIVEFSAPWCKPCKTIEPILEKLSNEYAGQVDIYNVDVDDQAEIGIKFGIKAVPSIIFIPMEQRPQIMQGAMTEEQFKDAINNVLLNTE